MDTPNKWIHETHWRRHAQYHAPWQVENIIKQVAPEAAITQSVHGFHVLNTTQLGFIDIDFDVESLSTLSLADRLSVDKWLHLQECETVAIIREWSSRHPEQTWRIYRTAHGLRLMRTDAPQSLVGEDWYTYTAFAAAVGADNMYMQIVKEQQCFRARISPKPHRIGVYWLWTPFDFRAGDNTHLSVNNVADIATYKDVMNDYKTCELVETVGANSTTPEDIKALASLHDEQCNVFRRKPLENLAPDELPRCSSWSNAIKLNEYRKPDGYLPDEIWTSLTVEMMESTKMLIDPEYLDYINQQIDRRRVLIDKWSYDPVVWKADEEPLSPEFQNDDGLDYFSRLAEGAA